MIAQFAAQSGQKDSKTTDIVSAWLTEYLLKAVRPLVETGGIVGVVARPEEEGPLIDALTAEFKDEAIGFLCLTQTEAVTLEEPANKREETIPTQLAIVLHTAANNLGLAILPWEGFDRERDLARASKCAPGLSVTIWDRGAEPGQPPFPGGSSTKLSRAPTGTAPAQAAAHTTSERPAVYGTYGISRPIPDSRVVKPGRYPTLPPPLASAINTRYGSLPPQLELGEFGVHPDLRFTLVGSSGNGKIHAMKEAGRVWDSQPPVNIEWRNADPWDSGSLTLGEMFADMKAHTKRARVLQSIANYGRLVANVTIGEVGSALVDAFMGLANEPVGIYRALVRLASLYFSMSAQAKDGKASYTDVELPRAERINAGAALNGIMRAAHGGQQTLIIPDTEEQELVVMACMLGASASPIYHPWVATAARIWPPIGGLRVLYLHEAIPIGGIATLRPEHAWRMAMFLCNGTGQHALWLDALRYVASFLRRPSGVPAFFRDRLDVYLPPSRLAPAALIPACEPLREDPLVGEALLRFNPWDAMLEGAARAGLLLSAAALTVSLLEGPAWMFEQGAQYDRKRLDLLLTGQRQGCALMQRAAELLGPLGITGPIGRALGGVTPGGTVVDRRRAFLNPDHHVPHGELLPWLPAWAAQTSLDGYFEPPRSTSILDTGRWYAVSTLGQLPTPKVYAGLSLLKSVELGLARRSVNGIAGVDKIEFRTGAGGFLHDMFGGELQLSDGDVLFPVFRIHSVQDAYSLAGVGPWGERNLEWRIYSQELMAVEAPTSVTPPSPAGAPGGGETVLHRIPSPRHTPATPPAPVPFATTPPTILTTTERTDGSGESLTAPREVQRALSVCNRALGPPHGAWLDTLAHSLWSGPKPPALDPGVDAEFFPMVMNQDLAALVGQGVARGAEHSELCSALSTLYRHAALIAPNSLDSNTCNAMAVTAEGMAGLSTLELWQTPEFTRHAMTFGAQPPPGILVAQPPKKAAPALVLGGRRRSRSRSTPRAPKATELPPEATASAAAKGIDPGLGVGEGPTPLLAALSAQAAGRLAQPRGQVARVSALARQLRSLDPDNYADLMGSAVDYLEQCGVETGVAEGLRLSFVERVLLEMRMTELQQDLSPTASPAEQEDAARQIQATLKQMASMDGRLNVEIHGERPDYATLALMLRAEPDTPTSSEGFGSGALSPSLPGAPSVGDALFAEASSSGAPAPTRG